MAEKIDRLGVPKGDPSGLKPTAIINNLLDHLDEIEEVYVVVKTKEGDFLECCAGNAGGVAFTIAVWMKYMMGLI